MWLVPNIYCTRFFVTLFCDENDRALVYVEVSIIGDRHSSLYILAILIQFLMFSFYINLLNGRSILFIMNIKIKIFTGQEIKTLIIKSLCLENR